jgi:deoxyribonuclease (pyrimidine dimer)
VTRINLVPVSELSRQHLLAEYREITRLPGNLNTWLNRKSKAPDFREIPTEYKLGTGHVKFFFTKMQFLEKRFELIVAEMLKRGYNPNYRDSSIFKNCLPEFYNDYEPTEKALEINRQRILERTK